MDQEKVQIWGQEGKFCQYTRIYEEFWPSNKDGGKSEEGSGRSGKLRERRLENGKFGAHTRISEEFRPSTKDGEMTIERV